jgi:hypothetical protein
VVWFVLLCRYIQTKFSLLWGWLRWWLCSIPNLLYTAFFVCSGWLFSCVPTRAVHRYLVWLFQSTLTKGVCLRPHHANDLWMALRRLNFYDDNKHGKASYVYWVHFLNANLYDIIAQTTLNMNMQYVPHQGCGALWLHLWLMNSFCLFFAISI